MTAQEIYAERLLHAKRGYVRDGSWIRLFNASKPAEDPYNNTLHPGVPTNHVPFSTGKIQRRTLSKLSPIMSKEVKRIGIHGDVSAGPVIESGGGFTFESSNATGAILTLGDHADSMDALDTSYFTSAIWNHRQDWLEFANVSHGRQISLWDVVLVTGYDRTSSWAAAVFSGSSFRFGINLDIQTGIAKATVLGEISKETHLEAMNSGPLSPRVRTSGDRDQCVFVRGYKMGDRKSGIMRRWTRRNKQPYDGYLYCDSPPKGNDDDGHNGGGGGNGGNESRQFTQPRYHSESTSKSGSSGSRKGSSAAGTSSAKHLDDYGSSSSDPPDDIVLLCEEGSVLDQKMSVSCLDIMLEFILEKSDADFALVHDDDFIHVNITPEVSSYAFNALCDNSFPVPKATDTTQDFGNYLYGVSPKVFVEDEIGMLEFTYHARLSITLDDISHGSFMSNTVRNAGRTSESADSEMSYQLDGSTPHLKTIGEGGYTRHELTDTQIKTQMVLASAGAAVIIVTGIVVAAIKAYPQLQNSQIDRTLPVPPASDTLSMASGTS
ncbi:hypothetical protein BU17DRAFT_89629 [Hysterangium stoloniferum]|nr:hypothetical protein BU17DRAFT_89629 [Hysterangium stoloniferum]